jgi:hypothetical protein
VEWFSSPLPLAGKIATLAERGDLGRYFESGVADDFPQRGFRFRRDRLLS